MENDKQGKNQTIPGLYKVVNTSEKSITGMERIPKSGEGRKGPSVVNHTPKTAAGIIPSTGA